MLYQLLSTKPDYALQLYLEAVNGKQEERYVGQDNSVLQHDNEMRGFFAQGKYIAGRFFDHFISARI